MRTKICFLSLKMILLTSFVFGNDEIPELVWPRIVEHGNAEITLYQPDIESFNQDILEGRMAVSIKLKDQEVMFGAVWFSAWMNTDKEERIVVLEDIDITQSRFPDVEEASLATLEKTLEDEIEGMDIVMSLDRLLSSLEMVEQEREMSALLNNAPPKIYYRSAPAMLIFVDGAPIYESTNEENYRYVVNTPYFIIKDTKSGQHYIKGGKWWFESDDFNSDWRETKKVPSSLQKLADEAIDLEQQKLDSALQDVKKAPEIIISTEPAELILTDGKPDYATIEGTSLLYVKNTESDVIMDINTQRHYILIAGRWYSARSIDAGEWEFQEPDQLPADFARIPDESSMAAVLPSVPGTEESKAAILEQSIPQTATIDRAEATVEVEFDGKPQFKMIDGTNVQYAINSDKSVLQISGKYYCVDDGIWFVSSNATGPWEVSIERPAEVDQIPPSAPVYNVKYVYVYDYTPEVVYVGYLPGYTHSYVYGGTVVYGTGYYYHPWYGTRYYPYPVTYGFRPHYNPYTGWGFSVGVSYGWFSVGWHSAPYNYYWGPHGYHYGYRYGYRPPYHYGYHYSYHHGYHQGYRAGYYAGRRSGASAGRPTPYSSNAYRNRSTGVKNYGGTRPSDRVGSTPARRPTAGTRPSAGTSPAQRPTAGTRPAQQPNQRPSTGTRPAQQPSQRPATATRPSQQPGQTPGTGASQPSTRPSTPQQPSTRPAGSSRANDVYTDSQGNVYRKNNSGGWDSRSNGSWNSGSNGTNRSNPQLDRSSQSRNQGNQRYNNYQSRPQSASPGSGGGRSAAPANRSGGRR